MKVISLNTWGGRKSEEIFSFLKKHEDVDVFCLQEVYHNAHGKDVIWTDGSNFNLLNDLIKNLPGYLCFYNPHLEDWWGLALFVKKGVSIIGQGDVFVHKYKGHNIEIEVHGHSAKNIQYVTLEKDGKQVTVMNFHGLWNGQGKDDSEHRITQSKNIIQFISKLQHDWILCGDFNLLPNTESLMMFEKELQCRDLIKEYGITSTRTSLYPKEHRFADYAFISQDIKLLEFKVLPDEVSDHSPLSISFDIL